jgi:hypothetical protein
MASPEDLAALFRECASGRREYLRTIESYVREKDGGQDFAPSADALRLQADTLDAVARVINGDLGPLYDWLPSWRWTDEMTRALFQRGDDRG